MKIKILVLFVVFLLCSCKSIQLSENEKDYILDDNGKDKFYLVKFIRQKQVDKILGEMPMLIIDGDPKFSYHSNSNKPANISKVNIKSIKIVDAEKCVQIFGAGCKYGLIIVNTNGKQEKSP